jgi:hypothetical protein
MDGMKWQGFTERFVVSVSFSAYLLLLRVIPPAEVRGLVPLWIAGVVCVKLCGLHDVFAMLAGQGIANLVPMPIEPSGYLVIPSVLCYLALISSVAWAVNHMLGDHGADTPMGGALATALDQYLSLFSVTRAVLTFTAAGQTYPLYVLSIAYTVLKPEGGELGEWRRNLEGVAMRGVSAWLMNEVLRPQSTGEALLSLQLVCVYVSGWYPRLSGIHAVLSASTAQHLLQLLRLAQLSEPACVCGVAALVALLTLYAPEHTGVFADLFAFVASLLLTAALDRWLVVGLLEAGTLYFVVFCVLDVLRRPLTQARLPAQSELGLLVPLLE